ncbi:MAG TPA: 3-hydroxybutyryl-CoA dehydrogenase [Clostridiales bacterium]|nr:3-hydroxybutyryl-CoA dehydrogenase [Clostridiales bacterium]
MKIAVIGAGTMGAGIAQVFASHDHEVCLCDLNLELAEKGRERIDQALSRLVAKGRMEQAARDRIMAGIKPVILDQLGDCALVIEAVKEDIGIKRNLFAALAEICGPDTLFATNTSALSVTELSAGLGRPLIGMHFFNPAPVMELVEVVSGLETPPEQADRVMEIARGIGKTPILVSEAPGFVVNRILIPMINEAVTVLYEGTASAEDIDRAMKLGAGHPMGPLGLADLIGLDVVLSIMETLHQETGDSKYRPCPLLKKMVRGGLLGRKTARGFFEY